MQSSWMWLKSAWHSSVKLRVWAPLLPFLVAINASKSSSVDAVILMIVERHSLISTTKRNLLLAFAVFAALGLLIFLLGTAIQCRQAPNSNRIMKVTSVSSKKNRACFPNVLFLLNSERSSSHVLHHGFLSRYGIVLGSCDTQFAGALASWAMLSLLLTTLLKHTC